MAIPRRQQISLDHTPYYHCTSRCVRRAFLCGNDRYSGQNFDHRKQWMENRLVNLANVFAIHLLAYAIMSNHYHVVVRLDPAQAKHWTDEEVAGRWGLIFSIPKTYTPHEVSLWRERLCSLSWYMRCLNEPLARSANREDECKGRFWEGRYRCQALLDETALLKCMAYVDLNPVRASTATTPESSRHTSVHARITGNDGHLMPFSDKVPTPLAVIPMNQLDYFDLMDWSGRQIRGDKRGHIPERMPPILDRLNIERQSWIREMKHYGRWYYRAVGSIASLERYCKYLGQQWLKGTANATKSIA